MGSILFLGFIKRIKNLTFRFKTYDGGYIEQGNNQQPIRSVEGVIHRADPRHKRGVRRLVGGQNKL